MNVLGRLLGLVVLSGFVLLGYVAGDYYNSYLLAALMPILITFTFIKIFELD